jgi:transposase-like protein
MSDFLEYHVVDLECPGCGAATPKTIRWVRGHRVYACKGCGATVSLDSEELRRRIRSLEDLALRMGL